MNQQETISIAIVKNQQNKWLITRRQQGQHLAGKWEFPGGKVEEGEALEAAMLRELKEEVDLTAIRFELFESLNFEYEALSLQLHFYIVSEFEGEAKGVEGQDLKWITLDAFADYVFPKANLSVIKKLSCVAHTIS